MSTIKYQSQKFQVPAWAQYIAADNDGAVYAYSHKPVLSRFTGGYHNDCESYGHGAQNEFLGDLKSCVIPPEGYFPSIPCKGEETNPAVESLIAQLHKGTIKASTLFAPPDEATRFFVGDVVRLNGSKNLEVITEINLYNSAVEYATTEGAWYTGSEFELVESSSAQTRARGYKPTLNAQKRKTK